MILNRQQTVRVARPPLELFLRRVRHLLKLDLADVTVCLVSDAEIAHMNESFRKKKGPTDVLSFPSKGSNTASLRRFSGRGVTSRSRRSANPRVGIADDAFLGDIAIAPATARRNAKKFGRTLPNELQVLILHGVLHLLGYDHETDNGQMARIENRLRRKLGLS
jgi:probable rRNA maturation factor